MFENDNVSACSVECDGNYIFRLSITIDSSFLLFFFLLVLLYLSPLIRLDSDLLRFALSLVSVGSSIYIKMTHHSTKSKHFSVQIASNETGNNESSNGEWWLRVRSHNRVHQRFSTISRTLSWLLVLLWSVPVFFSLLPSSSSSFRLSFRCHLNILFWNHINSFNLDLMRMGW